MLVADPDKAICDFLASWVEECASSNVQYGLTPMPLEVHQAYDKDSLSSAFEVSNLCIHIAFIAIEFLDDFGHSMRTAH